MEEQRFDKLLLTLCKIKDSIDDGSTDVKIYNLCVELFCNCKNTNILMTLADSCKLTVMKNEDLLQNIKDNYEQRTLPWSIYTKHEYKPWPCYVPTSLTTQLFSEGITPLHSTQLYKNTKYNDLLWSPLKLTT